MATPIPADKYQFQFYKQSDSGLIPQVDIDTILTGSSFIEFSIYNLNDELIYFNNSYKRYTVLNDSPSTGEGISQFDIDPDADVLIQGYDSGEYVAYYNFITNRIGSQFQQLYISEISSDRTELRLESTALSNFDIEDQTDDFIDFREENIYFTDFQLNFSNNQLVIANNIILDDEDENNPSILIKLYEPLPLQFDLQSQLYIVTIFANPEAFRVNYVPQIQSFTDSTPLQGPNFSIPIKGEVNNSSLNLSENDILLGSSTSSYNELQGLLSQSSINISIDYNYYNEFIHFSSAQTRLENFYYKTSLLEQYSGSIYELQLSSGSSSSITLFENKINSIITNFDGYDKFLYYQSGSKSWPKTNSTQPYELAKTGSIAVKQWYGSLIESDPYYGGQLYNAWYFDNQNPDQLLKAIPEYLREDSANQPYELFVDMVAQYYDNIWMYTKDVSQKYNADNRLDFGVSKDLVSDAIKDFGLKLYQNNFSNQELYTAFLGMTPNGSLFPFPEITGSLPAPTGYEFVDTLISASNDVISMDDTNKSLYKRIYHNIPYLLKSKGTITGLRALITSYGIPDTILRISEFGGKDKINANDYDLYSNNFNYAFSTDRNFINTDWGNRSLTTTGIESSWVPSPDYTGTGLGGVNTVQFRFKAQEITSDVPPYGLLNLSQSLWILSNDRRANNNSVLTLEYENTGLSSSADYLGSIPNPEYQYGLLKFYPDVTDTASFGSLYLPFFDGGWWSVQVKRKGLENFQLSAGNKIYNGNDGTSIGFYDTVDFENQNLDTWDLSFSSSFSKGNSLGREISLFSGSLQEIRYYTTTISESVFKDYVMNPLSFEGNGVNGAPDQLIFRAALGSELDVTTTSSIHPKATGSWAITSSFNKSNNFSFDRSPRYTSNTEYFFQDQPAAGIKNRINDKIRWESNVLPGNTLSQYRKIAQTTEASASYSENINYLEVAFSPQNQINDDIIGQMGHFNIGDYIGDPRQRSSRSIIYPDLNNLSENYFKKYIKQYDLVDFVRLIKFFDNSLFKMIKDFIPARTSLASGLVIKQHLLERDKYPQPQVSHSNESELMGCVKTHHIWNTASQETEISCSRIVTAEGGPAGMFNSFNNNYLSSTTSSFQTTQFRYSGQVGDIDPPVENTSVINFLNGTVTTNAPNLEWFNRFITSSYDGNPNLWIDLIGGGTSPFLSGSNYINSRRARVIGIDLNTSTINLDPGYVISATGITGESLSLYSSSFGNSSTFASSSTAFVTQTNYFYDTPPQFNITQSWEITEPTLSGSITYIHDSQNEFYNGELSGSDILVTNGELNEEIGWAKNPSYNRLSYRLRIYPSESFSEGDFNSLNNDPLDGFISIYNNFQ